MNFLPSCNIRATILLHHLLRNYVHTLPKELQDPSVGFDRTLYSVTPTNFLLHEVIQMNQLYATMIY